jgi:ferredoxin
MTHIITSLCLRDRGCIEVCPVECIVPGPTDGGWPMVYIDPDTCIDCGACIPECPYGAIFPEDEVPNQYIAKGGEYMNRSQYKDHYEGNNRHGAKVTLDTVKRLNQGEVVNLREDIQTNYDFFQTGPGYTAKDQDSGL